MKKPLSVILILLNVSCLYSQIRDTSEINFNRTDDREFLDSHYFYYLLTTAFHGSKCSPFETLLPSEYSKENYMIVSHDQQGVDLEFYSIDRQLLFPQKLSYFNDENECRSYPSDQINSNSTYLSGFKSARTAKFRFESGLNLNSRFNFPNKYPFNLNDRNLTRIKQCINFQWNFVLDKHKKIYEDGTH